MSNNTLPYVWNGGAITTPILKKNGPGSLTRVEGQADAIAGIELNEGSYVVSNFYDGTFATVLTDTSAGTGTFVKQGPSTLTVTSTNSTYDGTTLIQEGILKLGTDRALGATTGDHHHHQRRHAGCERSSARVRAGHRLGRRRQRAGRHY